MDIYQYAMLELGENMVLCQQSISANPVKFLRWQVVLAFDIITELSLVANSIYLVQELQLPLTKKGVVVLAFALRLP